MRQETFSAGFDSVPAISADGTLIAYEYDDVDVPSLNGIYVRPRSGAGTPVQLTVSPKRGYDTNADFSPDGNQVVFQRVQFNECSPRLCGLRDETGFTASIWVVGTDGSGLHRIVAGGQVWGDPHYTVRPDGSGMRQLTSGKSEVSFSGDWSPDGSRIVLVHYQFGDDHLEIQTIDADGTNPSTVADCDPDLFCDVPSWGAYDGPLTAATTARARTGVRASAAGRHAQRRLRRAIRRELRIRYVADRR